MGRQRGRRTASRHLALTRRGFLAATATACVAAGTAGAGLAAGTAAAEPPDAVRFGLTPVFLTNDLQLLSNLQSYLERATGLPVQLVTRRTYQEITALLVSGQLNAAWICGYPYVQFREQLELLAVPVWRGETLYQSYLIVDAARPAAGFADLAGDVHAFSDPDSNSGYLVTRALLAERGQAPEAFFRRVIFTYGHRNVVRAVASGLAQSGSVDGYVLEVLAEVEPELAGRVRVLRKSEWLGFPPVAAAKSQAALPHVRRLQTALVEMADDPLGREVLALLRLDGFAERPGALFDSIASKVDLVRSFG